MCMRCRNLGTNEPAAGGEQASQELGEDDEVTLLVVTSADGKD